MKIIFYLKGNLQLEWRVPASAEPFNFQIMCKLIRADGQFLAEGVYIQAAEIAAMILDRVDTEQDDDMAAPNVGVHRRPAGRVERKLVS